MWVIICASLIIIVKWHICSTSQAQLRTSGVVLKKRPPRPGWLGDGGRHRCLLLFLPGALTFVSTFVFRGSARLSGWILNAWLLRQFLSSARRQIRFQNKRPEKKGERNWSFQPTSQLAFGAGAALILAGASSFLMMISSLLSKFSCSSFINSRWIFCRFISRDSS